MKILHLYNDWKWTGPSEPIFNLCAGLKAAGESIIFAGPDAPPEVQTNTLPGRMKEAGVEIVPLHRPRKLTRLFAFWENINRVEKFITTQPVDIIHAHSAGDHFLAAKAIRHIARPPRLIRTNHKGEPLIPGLIANWLMKKKTDGYITLSPRLLEIDRSTFNLPTGQSWWLEGTVDITRFNPEKVTKNLRPELGLAPEQPVIGVVARIQRHRHFNIILAALSQLAKEMLNLRLLVIGRGTYQAEVLTAPAREMGLDKHIIHISQRVNDADYLNYVAAIDVGLFLVPGSDGSCRAVREMMALAKPVVVARRGILPELVEDKKEGLVVDDTVDNLCRAIRYLAADRVLISQYGQAARAKAVSRFTIAGQVSEIIRIYQTVSALPAATDKK